LHGRVDSSVEIAGLVYILVLWKRCTVEVAWEG
jgi:hypothetical protein